MNINEHTVNEGGFYLMFGFIKNIFKKEKTPEELIAEYESVKGNLPRIQRLRKVMDLLNEVRDEDLKSKEAPTLFVFCYKELLVLKNEMAREIAVEYIQHELLNNNDAQLDFIKQVSDSKEYKEWKLWLKEQKMMEDF